MSIDSKLVKRGLQEKLKRTEHLLDCMKRRVSPCCEAPLDESQVLTNGRHKGHGPRICSKCGRCVFMI